MNKKVKKTNVVESAAPDKGSELKVETPSAEKEAVCKTKAAKEGKETKSTTKKATEKKASTKVAAKEVKTPEPTTEQIFIQYAGNEYATDRIVSKIKAAWVEAGHKPTSIKNLNLYIKPEESAAYYVINDQESGKVEL